MRNLLMIAGALLLVATSAFGQEQAAIDARMRSTQERIRGSDVKVQEQDLAIGRQVLFTQVHKDTVEMNQLLQSINADVANLQKGILAADLQKKLKRLEKLAKGVRQAVE